MEHPSAHPAFYHITLPVVQSPEGRNYSSFLVVSNYLVDFISKFKAETSGFFFHSDPLHETHRLSDLHNEKADESAREDNHQ